jgi:hypothetical protein
MSMLEYLRHRLEDAPVPQYTRRYHLSDRKARLFAVACCYQVWDKLTDERSRRAVEIASRFADGEATEAELLQAGKHCVGQPYGNPREQWYDLSNLALWCCGPTTDSLVRQIPRLAEIAGVPPAAQAALLRDLVNPFRPVKLQPLFASRDTVQRCLDIAQAAYDARDWAALPVLWDALAEAGCEDEAIRAHCFEPLHARGCWLLDLLLGRE